MNSKKQIQIFYETVLNEIVDDNDNNSLKFFINKFIDEENILEKTSNKFDEKEKKLLIIQINKNPNLIY